jgi:aldehyde dehydrogenase (NAD(P)+)
METATEVNVRHSEIDSLLESVDQKKNEWARLSIAEKIKLLLDVRKNIGVHAKEWVELSVQGKQIDPASPIVGEEWSTGPWVLATSITNYIETLRAIESGHKEKLLKKVTTRDNGQVVAGVFPTNLYEILLFNGIRGEVWMQEGVDSNNLVDSIGVFYDQEKPTGKLSLVLGAGNISSIPPLDVLHKLLAEGEVVILKMNPINEYLGPLLEKVLEPFISRNYLQLVYGGADVGEYLTKHPMIETIHITGSERTHDVIVFGGGEEGKVRKSSNSPVLDPAKTLTSELGGIGPMIVVPGPWSKSDIDFQAQNIVSAKLHNSGHNCVASQVLVMPEAWDQSQDLIEAVTTLLRNVPPRVAYYPNATQSIKAAADANAGAEELGGDMPRLFIKGLKTDNEEYSYTNEFFGPVYAQTSVAGADAGTFLENAVQFCNDKLHGTLGATILVHPKTMKELGGKLDKAIADLKYGAVGVNIWNGVAFLISQCSWGAYPGHNYNDIQSGIGAVHNTFLFDKPQKAVLYGPFRSLPRAWFHGDFNLMPKPVWFVTNKTAATTTRRITKFAVNPGFHHLPAIFTSALMG